MFHTEHGFKHGFLTALNRCVAVPLFTVTEEEGQTEKNPTVSQLTTRMPKNLARERYLAIPTFIRQGKTLGL